MVELRTRPGQNEAPQAFRSVGIIGVTGQVGELLARTLAPYAHIEAVVRERRWRDEGAHHEIGFHTSIERMLATEPEVVILATPNPTDEVLKEIAQYAQKPLTLILPQNGVDVVPAAEKVLGSSRSRFTIVRASLFTNVSRDENGDISYNPKKKRIALSPVGDPDGSLLKAQNMFARAGFDVKVVQDYRSMEWSKLLANLFGSTSTVTGLSPREALSDPEIFSLEHRALKDRLRILAAEGIKVADLWGIGRLRWLSRVPRPIALMFREHVANMFAAERNNQPPAAARQINEGARIVEPTDFYHQPMLSLVEELSKKNPEIEASLRSPVDDAILDILTRHKGTNNDFSLTSLSTSKRKELLLEIFGHESKQLFVRGFLPLRLLLNALYKLYVGNFNISGEENLQAVAESLSKGKSVLLALNHRSHADHMTVIKALREKLPREARNYPVFIVAGMKFEEEVISGFFSRAYSHPIVVTRARGDSKETSWKKGMINRRAGRVIARLLEKPCIFVVYLEGGRSKTIINGKVQLQEPAPGSSMWLLNKNFGLVMPGVITGTERMLRPGRQWPQRFRGNKIAIKFLPPMEIDSLRSEQLHLKKRRKSGDREGRDNLVRKILERIARELPEDERGPY